MNEKPTVRILRICDNPWWHLMQPNERELTTAIAPVRGTPICRVMREAAVLWEALTPEDRAASLKRTLAYINGGCR